ncbi:MAG: hypothetical protein LBC77_05975 [Spirochaetaceae bacterium]|nr:hypothetical protein [Spirochaetaceae bacterium]
MKKVILIVFILSICGTGFFAGWAQIAVPVGEYGVLRSKTHGLRREVIRNGGFTWIWYRLIPGNTRLLSFKLPQKTFRAEFSGELPQSGTLAAFTGLADGYSWTVSGDLEISLKAESLCAITEENNIADQNALEQYFSSLVDGVSAYINSRISWYFENSETDVSRYFDAISKSGDFSTLKTDVEAAFPEILLENCRFTIKKAPDFKQWETARALYAAYLNRQRSLLEGKLITQAERKIAAQFRFDELARYGELLTKYPVLIDYLNIEARTAENGGMEN